jgi:N-acetylmuramoyl-L-alanine amidase
MSKIAHAYGFASYLTIWDAPENRELKERRKNPNILYPGDKLFIPDKETREESRATEKKHSFVRESDNLMLRIKLLDLQGQPVDGHVCALIVEGIPKEIKTKSDGILKMGIFTDHGTGKVQDRGSPDPKLGFRVLLEIPLKIGHLDPEDKVSGQIARLNNLGYDAGELPQNTLTDDEEEKLRKSAQFLSAVEEFQCDFGLNVDGKCGKNTQEKLVKVHGC